LIYLKYYGYFQPMKTKIINNTYAKQLVSF